MFAFLKDRYFVINLLIVLVGATLIGRLFDLQVVNGKDYRLQSQSRILKDATVLAPRGPILDRYGQPIATSSEGFNVQIFKTKMDEATRNLAIYKLIQVLTKNNDKYTDTLPIQIDPIRFDFGAPGENRQRELTWKKQHKFKPEDTAVDVFNKYIDTYQIVGYKPLDTRKIVGIRYQLSENGYGIYNPYEIATNVSRETVVQVEERYLEFPGINISIQPIRNYPNGALASHIIGYVGKIDEDEYKARKEEGYSFNDTIGKNGIEGVMEKYLRGINGLRRRQVDSSGKVTGELGLNDIIPGDSVYLTIDYKLQQVAEKSLMDTINKINTGGDADKFEDAQSGAVVAIDVNSGEVLAMASYPNFDPTVFVKGVNSAEWNELNNKLNPMFNRAISGIYSPGSTFKMVTAITALETGKVGINETVKDQGVYDKGQHPKCWIYTSQHRTHGYVNVSNAIKVSCNYYFYEMGYRIGIDNLEKYAQMFGLGKKTGIELYNESDGTLAGKTYASKRNDDWYLADTLSAAIGQSYNSFTPIQMANYIATLANGGTKYRPHLIKEVKTYDGKVIPENEVDKEVSEELKIPVTHDKKLDFNPENVKAVFEGMGSVTGDAGGTAYSTFNKFPVKIAGKTGTAQTSKGSDNAWFVGFAPYDKPQIAIAVIIEHGGHGGYTAPVARDMLAEYFGLNEKNESIDTQAKPDINTLSR